jgi:hypothetical protein
MWSEDTMSRPNGSTGALAKAVCDYERAKQVWKILAKKQQENDNQTTFVLNGQLLKDLGFTKEDFHDNIKDLQSILTRLEEFTWHWDRSGPLSSKPGEPSPIASIVDYTLVLGSQFASARTAFAAYSKAQDEKQPSGA